MSRKIFAKLNFNIEQYPKDNWTKGKKGTYGDIDIVINIDDPHVFENGNKNYSNISLPQTKEDRENEVPKDYLNGWTLVINSVGRMVDGKFIKDEEWYKNNKQDTVPDKVEDTVKDTVDDKGDLPF
tara:strand:+ start:269 stop:646 length:378 start_codon:yes stop_codon:yes gene_type:complete